MILDQKLLSDVAKNLGENWIYNDVLSDQEHGAKILNNRAGLFIYIRMVYGEKLPQFKIGYKHPTHKNFIPVFCVGCSLEKRLDSIVSDLKARLLMHSITVYEELKKITLEEQEKNNQAKNQDLEIAALKRVFNLRNYYDHRQKQNFIIEDLNGNNCAELIRSYKKGFSLKLESLSIDKIIKIMQIVDPALFK